MLSTCHQAPTRTINEDEGTCFAICTECHKPCNFTIEDEEPVANEWYTTSVNFEQPSPPPLLRIFLIRLFHFFCVLAIGSLLTLAYVKFAYEVHVSDLGDLILLKR